MCRLHPQQRRSMAPPLLRRGIRQIFGRPSSANDGQPGLRIRPGALAWRRTLLLALVLVPSGIAAQFMLQVLPYQGRTWLEAAIVLVFAALFGWISIGLWTSILGFMLLAGGRDRYAISRTATATAPLPPEARTAIVVPVYNEDMQAVCARLQATYESVAATGQLARFDFFLISDSQSADAWVREEAAWAALCERLDAYGRIAYRRRHGNIKRKSGNVADFCRRWGANYRYMVVFDADSVMTGEALVHLVAMMQANPRAGLIQTLPQPVGARSLFARTQQFAGHCYGRMFGAGLHFWQLGDSQFWGHNAIIRVAPFMAYCALPRLPGGPPLGGDILSHDFVESALLRRAGWQVWLAYDLPGSFEETPPTLIDELTRDRRWCQGNLQHLRLLLTDRLLPAHRFLFLNGVMSYVSALLWLIFLTLSTAQALRQAVLATNYFPTGPSLFPRWPTAEPHWALMLLAATGLILFLPKLLAILLVLLERRRRAFGGLIRLTGSVLTEIALSTLLAPVRALFHSKFVVFTLLGRHVDWQVQNRGERATRWADAFRFHTAGTLVALVWGTLVYVLDPGYFWWLLPILAALVLAVPVSVLASSPRVGAAGRRAGLLIAPPETRPLPVMTRARALAEAPAAAPADFFAALQVPAIHALHLALLGTRRKRHVPRRAAERRRLFAKARHRAQDLDGAERRAILTDPPLLAALHRHLAGRDPAPAPDRRAASG